MLKHYDTVNICTAYVCAIEYGDYSGLDDEEYRLVNAWLNTLPSFLTFDYKDGNEFARDCISGLMADCIEVDIYSQEVAA